MTTTFTHLLKPFIFISFFWLSQVAGIQPLYAQANQTTPTFNVNLSGDPNGTWTSEEITRNGQLCGAPKNENCVQFNITLNENSGGLQFLILSGPEPSGSMGYQLECGSQQPVGQPICVNGTGPHKLTLCMPGNAKGKFQIRSIPAFYPVPDASVTKGCSATLQAPTAFQPETITWKDITGGGQYDKYLSFPNGKATPVITPDANAPAYVDYQVCGTSQTSQCATLPYCDVVRVYFYAPPVVSIGPEPAIICPGANSVLLTGTVTGGTGSFSYIWTDNNGNQVATTKDYAAPAIGTYHLEVKNANLKDCVKFASSISVVNNLVVDAGPDQRVCSLNNVILTGMVTGATGGIWSGGAGTFVSGTTSLNNGYQPTAAELQQGSVKLTLTSTGNGSCSAQKDEVIISFYTVEASITGPAVICTGSTASLTAIANGAQDPTFEWNTGEKTATITGKPAGNYSVIIRDGNNCAITKSFTITEVAGPSNLEASLKPTTCGASNGEITISGVTGGTAPYAYSKDGTNFQTATTFTGLLAGNFTLTVKDANGCTFVRNFTLTNIAGPAAVAATATQAASCKNNDGSLAVGTVTGGTAPYTYAIDGTSFQTSTTFSGLAAQTYTVTAKDANGCLITTAVTIVKDIPISFTSSTMAATCGSNNGQINITGITGGKAPYTYTKNLITYQSSATFAGLAAATYTITIKDANGCVISGTIQVNNISGTTDLTAAVKATTCGDSNGELAITGVSGGTAPYTYSLNNNPFQTSATFTGIAAAAYQVHVKDANGCIYSKEVTVPNIAGPGFTATTQSSTCSNANGSIAISAVTGGTAPYTYSKDGSTFQTGTTFTALAGGNYSITVKDANGCLSTKAITLNNIAGPTDVNLTAAASTCGSSNGSIAVSGVTGGSAPYSYAINGGSFQTSTSFTALSAAEYTIAVQDANGCTFSKKITVNNVAGPSAVAASLKASTCGSSNGEINITGVTGGTAPYTYSQDGATFQTLATFTNLAARDYAITVKDANGCTFVRTFTLTNIAGPTAVAATATQAASCKNNDGSLAVGTVTGGTAPYKYAINGNFQTATTFSGLAAGTYTVTAQDANNCTVTTSVTIVTNVPTSFASTTTSSTCGSNNGALTITGVTGGTAPYTYSRNNSAFQTSATFSALTAGAYTIMVKDAKGCTFAGTVQVNNITGPADLTASAQTSTCGGSNGQIIVTGVSGGTAPYTYSKDGTTFQASATFANLLASTYTVSVKDANGCIYTEEVVVPNIAGPAFAATAQSSTCGNSNGSISISNVSGGTAPYTYSKDGTTFQTAATFNNLAAGNYNITTKDANGCLATQAVTLNNIAGPTNLTLTTNASTCGSSNGRINAGTVTGGTGPYTYSKDGTTFQAEASFTSLLAGDYTITVKDANGCTFSKKITVNDIAGPTAITATIKATTCGASNGEITITGVTGGTAPYTYSKDGTNFQATITFAGLAARDYTITVKDANGCTFVRTFTLTNIAGPTAVVAATQPASCKNNDGTITAGTVTGGTAPYTYAVNGTSFQASTTFAGLAAGTYTVTAKDANGCTITTSVAVGTNIPTSFTSSTTSSTCGSNNGQLTVTGVNGGTAPYTYSKDGTTFQGVATFTGLIAGNYTITVKDANGCTFAGTVQINNIGGPSDLTASVKATTCSNNNGEVTISGVTGGTAPYSYAKGEAAFQSTNTFTALLAGTYVFRIKDANGCIYTEEVTINNIAGPAFAATAQSSTCGNSNGSISISNVSGGTAPYTYSKDGTTFQTTATFNNLAAGNYNITTKDANGCLATQAVTLNNIAGPTNLTLSTNASTCGSSNGVLEITGITGGTAPYTYTINGNNFQSGTTFTNLLAGEYTVTVKDANGCSTSKKININNVAGPAAVAATLKASTCGASNGELTVTGVTGGSAPYTYSKDGTNFQATTTFAGLTARDYAITVKDANGCTFVRIFTLTNIAGPTAVAGTSGPATCADNDGTITAGTVTGGTAPYRYAINGQNFQTAVTFAGLASGSYTLTAKDANGCTTTTTVAVGKNIPTSFTSTTTASTCGSNNGGFTITGVTGGTAPYTYSLENGNFGSSATFTALAAGTYQVRVKDANNCYYTGTVQVSNLAGPAFTATAQSTTCGSNNGSISISNVSGGTAPYTYSKDGINYQSSLTFNGLLAGEYTVIAKDANGCLYSRVVQVQDIAGPRTFAVTKTSTTCGNSNGSITITGITGGTAPYKYALNGSTFQSTATFNAIAASEHTLTIQDANGCTASQKVIIENIAGPADLVAGNISSTCGSSNGKLEVTGVTGGTAPYLFRLDGTAYQSATTFADLAAGQHTITVKDANGCTYAKSFTISNIPGPTAVAATSGPATCADNDGRITAGEVTGGTAPYSYSIDGANYQTAIIFQALASGSYTLRAKDANGCIISQQINVGKVLPTSFTSTTVAATCGSNDGQITITGVSGGTAPYTYSLDGTNYLSNATFTNLLAGSHAITVKDVNGCTYTGQVQVNDKGGPADLLAAVKSSTCGNRNGEINISSVSGGTAPFTYSLDGTNYQNAATFTALAAGKYQVSVKDVNGCLYTEEVQIIDLAAPTFIATAQSSTCGHSNATITISSITGGTSPITFSKDGTNFQPGTSFSGLAAGTYIITAKDANGCLHTVAVEVENIPGPTDFTLASVASTCGGRNGRITVSAVLGGTHPYTYAIDGTNFQGVATFETVLAGAYTVTVKDANGCILTKNITVNDIAGPANLAATPKPTTCGASNGEIRITAVTGGTAPYTYSKDGTTFQTATTFTGLPAGDYTITVKDANGCTFVKTYKLGNLAGPTALAATVQAASCADNDGRISIDSVTGGQEPYSYSIDGNNYQAGVTFSALALGNYTVTVKDANGCTITEQVKVEKHTPTDFTSTTTAATCGTNNGQLTITAVTGGTAPYTYSIGGITYQPTATFTALASGDYQVSVKDARGCIYTKMVPVKRIVAPAFTATAQAATCGTSNGSISVGQITGGTAPYSFSQDGTNYQTATTFSNLSAGTFTITLRDANGCMHQVSVAVENIPGPTNFSLTTTATSCGDNNGKISFGPVTGGTAPYSYSIGANTLNNNAFQSSPDFNGIAAGTYTATVKDANGCTLKKEVTLENNAGLTDIRATALSSACSTNTGSITVDGVKGGTTPYTYSLDNVNFQSSASFSGLAPKAYTVYVKDVNGCRTSTTVSVNTNGPQDAALTATSAVCTTNNGTITITGVAGGTQPYTYSINGGTFQASAQFTNLAAGAYTVTIRDAGGCTLTRSQAVGSTGSAASFTTTTTEANCSGANGQLTISNISGGKTPYTYSLDGTTFQASATFTKLAAGDYQVLIKDAGGCIYSQAATIKGSAPLANLQVNVTPAGCGQNSGQVLAQSVTGGTGPYTYSLNGVNFSSSATFNGVAPGQYTLTVKDAANCSLTAAVTVTTVSSTLAQVKDVSCFGAADGEISIAATGTTDQTEYSIDNGLSFHKQAVFSNLSRGVYQVITRFSGTCAINIGKAEVKGPAEIKATVTPLAKTFGQENSGSAAITQVEGGAKPYTYQLDNGNFTPNTEFKNLSGGTHTLLIKDGNGCTTSVTFTIEALEDIEIPNGFTPNGDGINDTWSIKNISRLYPRCKVSVYNRWGSLVFQSVGYTWEWDGSYNTQKLPDGTYYYLIELDDTKPALKKSVTIMR